MRAMVLNDGETFTALAGCKIVDVEETLDGDEVDAAIKAGHFIALLEFDDFDAGALTALERARLRALLEQCAGLHERSASLTHIPAAERQAHSRDAKLLRRHSAVI
jgi:hypothetical protein